MEVVVLAVLVDLMLVIVMNDDGFVGEGDCDDGAIGGVVVAVKMMVMVVVNDDVGGGTDGDGS